MKSLVTKIEEGFFQNVGADDIGEIRKVLYPDYVYDWYTKDTPEQRRDMDRAMIKVVEAILSKDIYKELVIETKNLKLSIRKSNKAGKPWNYRNIASNGHLNSNGQLYSSRYTKTLLEAWGAANYEIQKSGCILKPSREANGNSLYTPDKKLMQITNVYLQ